MTAKYIKSPWKENKVDINKVLGIRPNTSKKVAYPHKGKRKNA